MALVALAVSSAGVARGLPSTGDQRSHYTVRFGATIGDLEPVAGEVLCARDRDCEILLSFMPRITIRLRADPGDIRYGLARIDCADLQCALNMQEREVSYGAKVNDLVISTGRGGAGVVVDLVWHPRRELGRFTFVVAP